MQGLALGPVCSGLSNYERPADAPARFLQDVLDYAKDASGFKSPMETLDRLHAITSKPVSLNVLGALKIPGRATDWDALRLGETVFLHSSAPKGWWEEWIRQVPHKLPVAYALALLSMAPYTMTESLQMLQPIGIDRWEYDLATKYGIRDAFLCPASGRWVVGFWAAKPMAKKLSQPVRILLFTAASFAAMRMDQLVQPDPSSKQPLLTPRELAVLRLLSIGTPFKEAAELLGLGEETVRTHLRKVQAKLGVRNRTHAVSEAIRQRLIP